MSTNLEVLQTRLRDRLEASGLSARAASIIAVKQPDAINNILNKGASPTFERLIAIADALGTNVGYLIGTTNDPTPDEQGLSGVSGEFLAPHAEYVPPSPSMPLMGQMNKDVPVYGTALGGDLRVQDAPIEGQLAELTTLNTGEVIDFLRRPPALAHNRKIYGLYVVGTSMEPVFDSGSAIVIEPTRPPSIRDYVVVYLRDRATDADGGTSAVLIKRLVRRSASFVELEQYNPPCTFRIPAADVSAMHRVLSVTEMLGA
jgi:transcriptional regulator with XRE-family HTH domain